VKREREREREREMVFERDRAGLTRMRSIEMIEMITSGTPNGSPPPPAPGFRVERVSNVELST